MRVLSRIRRNWNRTDTFVVAVNIAAFLLFIGNAWWDSLVICYFGSSAALALLALYARKGDPALPRALAFGLLSGLLWPVGEGLVVNTLGWWGGYIHGGPRIWETPAYCILIGSLASCHCVYVGERAREMGFSLGAQSYAAGSTAFFVGVIGENLFVAADMWYYLPSGLDVFDAPLFVPVAYGLGYGWIPLLRGLPLVLAVVIFSVILLMISVAFGLAAGFFPAYGGV